MYLSTDQILEQFSEAIEPALHNAGISLETPITEQVRMYSQFYIAGGVSLYMTWLRSSKKTPVENVSTAIEEAVALFQVPQKTKKRGA